MARVEPHNLVDRYLLERPLGMGGLAVVYSARHTELDTVHAVKVLTVTSASLQERLLREGKAQATLHHPHIVRVTDVIRVQGTAALVMELVDGPSLAQWLAHARPTLDQIDVLGRGILAAMACAHDAGVIHRDLKPGNILLDAAGTEIIPKVADFGLAKQLDQDGARTRTGAELGTPAYMAPEQTRDASRVDERADIWALGTVLYELATGRQAFDHEDIVELYNQIRAGQYHPVLSLNPALPRRMVDAIEGALRVARDDRWSSMQAMLECWIGDADAPVDVWCRDDLVLARSTPAMVQTDTITVFDASDSATFATDSMQPLTGSMPAITMADAPSLSPGPGQRRQPWLLGGLVLGAVLAITVSGLISRGISEPVSVAATVSTEQAVQNQYQLAWEAALHGDVDVAQLRLSALPLQEDEAEPVMLSYLSTTLGSGTLPDLLPVVRSNRDDLDTRVLRLIHRSMNQDPTAVRELDALLASNPRALLPRIVAATKHRGIHPDLATQWLDEAIALAPERVLPYAVKAETLIGYEQYEEASRVLDLASRADGEAAVILRSRARLAELSGDTDQAFRILERAMSLWPGDHGLRVDFAIAALHRGDEGPFSTLQDAVFSDATPAYHQARLAREVVTYRLKEGRYEDAMAVEQQLFDLNLSAGHYGKAVVNRIQYLDLRVDAYQLDWERELNNLRTLLASPEIPDVIRNNVASSLLALEGIYLAESGEPEAAQRAYARLQALESETSSSMYDLQAAIAVARNDPEGVREVFSRAPRHCETYVMQGVALTQLGDRTGRAPLLQALEPGACDQQAWRVSAHVALAELDLAEGDVTSAREHLDAVTEIWPNADRGSRLLRKASALRERLH